MLGGIKTWYWSFCSVKSCMCLQIRVFGLSESGEMKFCIKKVELIESELDKICQSSC